MGEGNLPSCLSASIRDRNEAEGFSEGYKELEQNDSEAYNNRVCLAYIVKNTS
jgi:hypothetical protein